MRTRYIRVSDYRIKKISALVDQQPVIVYSPIGLNDLEQITKKYPHATSISDVSSYEVALKDKINLMTIVNAIPEIMLSAENEEPFETEE